MGHGVTAFHNLNFSMFILNCRVRKCLSTSILIVFCTLYIELVDSLCILIHNPIVPASFIVFAAYYYCNCSALFLIHTALVFIDDSMLQRRKRYCSMSCMPAVKYVNTPQAIPLSQPQCPTSSLNSLPQAGFRLISSTKRSNF